MNECCDKNAYERIFDVSINLFLTNGFEKTTVRMILDNCGMNSGSLYYLFSNKEEILKSVIEAFYGDILCKSGKLSRQYNDKDLMVILPTAFMLYASSISNNLARLLYQAHCSWPIMTKILDMTVYWTKRDNITQEGEYSLRSDLLFLMGGVGNMIGELYHSKDPSDYRSMLGRFSEMTHKMLGMSTLEDPQSFLDMVCGIVESEGLLFIERDIGKIDENYRSCEKEGL